MGIFNDSHGPSVMVNGEAFGNAFREYLDQVFYAGNVTDFIRVRDKERNARGVDTTFALGDEKYICRELYSQSHAGSILQTYSMEITRKTADGKFEDGFLLDKSKRSNAYLFCWIDETKGKFVSSPSEIISAEVALVDRASIMIYLFEHGFNETTLKEKGRRLIQDPKEYLCSFENNGVTFRVRRNEKECSTSSVLFQRKRLIEIADLSRKLGTVGKTRVK